MGTIVSMLLSGTCCSLLSICILKLTKKTIPFRWQCNLVKLSLLMFLMPLDIVIRVFDIFHFLNWGVPGFNSFRMAGSEPMVAISSNEWLLNMASERFILIIIVWFVLALLIYIYFLITYIKHKKRIMRLYLAETINDISYSSIKQMLSIRRKICIYEDEYVYAPFTTGIMRPIIYLPKKLSQKEREMVVYHELIHIKHFDVLFRFLSFVCIGLFWFHPLVYVLKFELNSLTELSCDEETVHNFDADKRSQYAKLLIELATKFHSSSEKNILRFTNKNGLLKERITFIMKRKTWSRSKKICSIILTSVIFGISCIPAFAYSTDQNIIVGNFSAEVILADKHSEIEFQPEQLDSDNLYNIESIYDNQFTDKNGIASEVVPPEKTQYINCNHSFADGTFSKHTRKSNGGCITQYYEAKQCIHCSYLVVGSLLAETTLQKCSH